MADAVQSSCTAPSFKRPRLDFSTRNVVSESRFDGFPSPQQIRDDLELQTLNNEVTSTSDSQLELNGDSGFHDSLPPSQGVDSVTTFTTTNYQHYSGNEPDTSSFCLDEDLCTNMAARSPDRDYEDNDDDASTVSELSGLSDFSNFDGSDNKLNGPYEWILKQMESGFDPRQLLSQLLPGDTVIPPNLSDTLLWRFVFSLLNEPPARPKLDNINTMEDVISLLQKSRNIIVLTGAGVSVSCGIPDFRSKNGVYARLSQDYPDLPDPQAMFDIQYFRKNPRPFFKFAKEIYPGQFHPSPSHNFIRQIESNGKLLRNYTQNIDTLEHIAGIEKVITCHGSFATATCTVCRYRVDSSVIKEDIFEQRIPYCPICSSDLNERGIMKPDIVFFGEGLSDEFHDCMAKDKDECDLLIVMGSSLKVRPVALIPNTLPPHVPQILINREPLKHLNFDVELLGDCDVIITELCRRLGWKIKDLDPTPMTQITSLPSEPSPVESHFQQLKVDNPPKHSETSEDTSVVEASSSKKTSHPPAPEEESNSCGCRGLSAINLNDNTQDGSSLDNSEVQNKDNILPPCMDDDAEQDAWAEQQQPKDSISSSLPENTYLFVSPHRYIFRGAEVYQSDICEKSPASPKRSPYVLDIDSSSSSSNEEDNVGNEDDDSAASGKQRKKPAQSSSEKEVGSPVVEHADSKPVKVTFMVPSSTEKKKNS